MKSTVIRAYFIKKSMLVKSTQFFIIAILGIFLFACNHTQDSGENNTGEGTKGITPGEKTEEIIIKPAENNQKIDISFLSISNAEYVKEKLGEIAGEPWFTEFPAAKEGFYIIAVSGKNAD